MRNGSYQKRKNVQFLSYFKNVLALSLLKKNLRINAPPKRNYTTPILKLPNIQNLKYKESFSFFIQCNLYHDIYHTIPYHSHIPGSTRCPTDPWMTPVMSKYPPFCTLHFWRQAVTALKKFPITISAESYNIDLCTKNIIQTGQKLFLIYLILVVYIYNRKIISFMAFVQSRSLPE